MSSIEHIRTYKRCFEKEVLFSVVMRRKSILVWQVDAMQSAY